MNYWSGKVIKTLEANQIFVFGSNPEGRHGMGAAKAAMSFGAKYGKGRGLHGQTYALVTKNLKAGFTEADGTHYKLAGNKSVSLVDIRDNIQELYCVALSMPDKEFLVTYQNGSKNLNGYTPQEILGCFHSLPMGIPNNVLMHDSFKPKIFKVLIAGGRDFSNFSLLTIQLDSLLREKVKTHKIIIVSGKAAGADKLGEDYAKLRGYEIETHPADWKNILVEGAVIKSNKYGEYNAVAGHMRNEDMAISCDVGVLFWDGSSTGTGNMLSLLTKYNKPCRAYFYDGEPIEI